MSEAPDVGSTETQANPKPEALTVREAADRLAARRQEVRQAPVEAQESQTPPVNAEPAEMPSVTAETAEADAIDYNELNMAEVAAPVAERDQDQLTADAAPEPEFSLVYEGQERKVNRKEAIDLAQMGLDYRKKTQDLADQRRGFEAQQAALQAELDGLRKDREQLATHLQKFTNTVQPPDPELANTDYEAFNEQMAKYQASQLQAEQVAKDLDSQREKESRERQEQAKRAYETHMQRLHSRVPEMAKRDVSHAVGRYLTEGMQFSPDELIQGVVAPADSRFQEIAYKAMMYDHSRMKAKNLRPRAPSTSTGGQRTGMVSSGPQKPTGKDARDPRKVADYLKQRKAR